MKRKFLRCCVLLILLATANLGWAQSGSSSSVDASPDAPSIPANFVGVTNGNFSLNGRRFRHVGVNLLGEIYEQGNQQWQDLDGLRDAGVKQIRVFLPNNVMTTQQIGDRLAWTLHEAYDLRGIRLTVVLCDYAYRHIDGLEGNNGKYVVSGDEPYYIIRNGDWTLKHTYFTGGFRANYLPFVNAIAARFRNHPGIFAWEVGNEVKDPEAAFDNSIVNFYTETAANIKASDPNHLVTTGIISTGWVPLTDPQKVTLYSNSNINYLTEHFYDDGDPRDLQDKYLARDYNKPLVIEECGYNWHDARWSNPDILMQRVQSFFSEMYNDAIKPADAVMIWGADWGNHGSLDGNYGPYAQFNPQFPQGLLPRYISLWQNWAQVLENGNGGPPPGPGGLTATPGCTSIAFSWNASPGATGYYVDIAQSQYDLDYMVGTFQNHPNGTATSYNWTNLAANTSYYWRIWAYNGAGGNHGYPTPRFSTTTCGAPPGPGGLAASPGCTSIAFSWNASPGATGYYVDIANSWDDLVNMRNTFRNHSNGAATSYNWTGLSSNANYYWRVWAYNGSGGNHGYPSPAYVTTGCGSGVSYEAHEQNYGWMSWVSNGAVAGTVGQGLRMEALRVNLDNPPSGMMVCYQAHVQNYGWMTEVCGNGQQVGTTGQNLRMEAIKIRLVNGGGRHVCYQTHVQNIGWQGEVCDNTIAGTTGQSLRIEAIKIRLTGSAMELAKGEELPPSQGAEPASDPKLEPAPQPSSSPAALDSSPTKP